MRKAVFAMYVIRRESFDQALFKQYYATMQRATFVYIAARDLAES